MNRSTLPNRCKSSAWIESVRSLPILSALFLTPLLSSQDSNEEEVFELSPFTVDGSQDDGYRATSTLAGSRIRTELKDVGAAVTVITKEFLEDLGAVDNETLLAYTPSMEVGGTFGNFSGASGDSSLSERDTFNNPNGNTRVRGLAQADNTRNFFLSDVPWDGYVVDRVDMSRGPSAILFGLGSPAGVINATTQDATFNDERKLEIRVGSYGSMRAVAKANVVLIEDQLATKVAVVSDRQKFRQDPAFDDRERIYLAAKWKPKFLNGEGKRFTFNANFEHGNVRSNRPRVLTPRDNITPFFNPVGRDENGNYPEVRGIGKGTFDPAIVRLGEFDELGLGGQLNKNLTIDGVQGVPNPLWTPALGNFAQVFGGPIFVYGSGNGGLDRVILTEPHFEGALGVDDDTGEVVVDNAFDNYPYTRMTSIGGFVGYANAIKLPGHEFGLYKDKHLTDSSIFNFYDKLIDGDNKNEWADWDALNISIEQTFLNDKIGFEVSYYDQQYSSGQVSLFVNDAIYVDTNSHLADGNVNPNAGRPFVSDAFQSGNNFSVRDRDSYRVSAFAEYDFRDRSEGMLARVFGKHRVNLVSSEENLFVDGRGFHRFRMENAYADYTGAERYSDNANQPNFVHYIGPALFDYDSAAGLNLSNLAPLGLLPSTADVRYFDTTWTATGVDPAAEWINADGDVSTQSENWDNYLGWTTRSFNVLDALEGDNMDQMSGSGNLSDLNIQSKAAVWQGWFLDDSIVGMYGVREDSAQNYVAVAQRIEPDSEYALEGGPTGYVDVRPSTYKLPTEPNLDITESSTSYSVVAHLDALPGMDWMPLNVSVSYNESENFMPAGYRADMFGHQLDLPTGETVDRAISISTKDKKYSLKITDYETSSNLSDSSYIPGTWMVGRFVAWGENWKNVYKHQLASGWDLSGVGDHNSWRWTMKDPDGNNNPEFMQKAVSDWEDFVSAIHETFPDYGAAWSLDDVGGEPKFYNTIDPAGLTYTQDAVSKGREYEFYGRITENWNLTFNAAQTHAVRSNVGGEAMIQWVEFVDKWFNTTNAGDIRIWSGGGPTINETWQGAFRSNYALTELLESTASSELREWRFNAVTRYAFKDGRFKGLNLGGAVRWGDEAILGYPPIVLEDGSLSYDLDNPYLGPDDTQFDFFANYTRKLGNGTRWKIQLNVRDLFADDDLIPLNVQPDGTPAGYRIPSDRTWSITNSFEF
ncbi:TonB-dependent receptor plug domain-containing protein [Pelagicoccus sp. SDUM812005]|uniref:TonB-dependent receptor plug domain-containing protein n=1 Tax=Pelagicoccus sp. SDUM812005 TaxID=3041257 RepID=UPI00280F8134|nr:TonB-dependent receptor plug domain-containing protein [Pelagicoccus sp. SDUM812005]MDQ8180322.1 TonB-dependent receptor plug domain-containing protein [Pelagicoccus sp. SDUM812005]